MALPSDADLLKKVRRTKSWQQNARFERFDKPGDLLSNIRSALRYLGCDNLLESDKFEQTTGRLFNLIKDGRARARGQMLRTRTKVHKKQLAEPKLF